MVKVRSESDPDTTLYLDDSIRRVIATRTNMPQGGFLIHGPQDTILACGTKAEADRIARRFEWACR